MPGLLDEHYYDGTTIDRWSFDASRVTQKLRANVPDGREDYVLVPGRDGGPDQQQPVVPGSEFTGHYVLGSIADTLRL